MAGVEEINVETFNNALRQRAARQGLLVLIAEDQRFSRMMLKDFLEKDHKVVLAADGQEALVKYVAYAPDVMFLDIGMPAVDGHRVRDLVVKLDPDSCVIMVTASNHKSDVERSINGGAKAFVLKPYTKAKIYECIHKYLLYRQSRRPSGATGKGAVA
jgi:CheY-like chemotaxis protein